MTIEEDQKAVDGWVKTKGSGYFDILTNTTILNE